jgi:hypothetical protein
MDENKLLARIIHLECKVKSMAAEITKKQAGFNTTVAGQTKYLLNLQYQQVIGDNPELAHELQEISNNINPTSS